MKKLFVLLFGASTLCACQKEGASSLNDMQSLDAAASKKAVPYDGSKKDTFSIVSRPFPGYVMYYTSSLFRIHQNNVEKVALVRKTVSTQKLDTVGYVSTFLENGGHSWIDLPNRDFILYVYSVDPDNAHKPWKLLNAGLYNTRNPI